MFPPLILPPIDPDILFLVMVAGAIAGALGTGATYLAFEVAEANGGKQRILPEIPPFLVHRSSNDSARNNYGK